MAKVAASVPSFRGHLVAEHAVAEYAVAEYAVAEYAVAEHVVAEHVVAEMVRFLIFSSLRFLFDRRGRQVPVPALSMRADCLHRAY